MQIHNAVITGSFSYNGADLSNVTSSNAYSASLSSRTSNLESTSSVLVGASSSFSSILTSVSSSQQQISSSLLNVIATGATTGSNSFRANQSITGSLTVTGQIIAQSLNVQQVTSSIVFSSGSNTFGSDLNSRQTFTGSVNITGSQTVFGNVGIGTTSTTHRLNISTPSSSASGIQITKAGVLTSFLGDGGSEYPIGVLNLYDSGSQKVQIYAGSVSYFTGGNVGIRTTTPQASLHIAGLADQNALTIGANNAFEIFITGSDSANIYHASPNQAIFLNTNGGTLHLGPSNASTLLTISGSNVGIGTSTPTATLQVRGPNAVGTFFDAQNLGAGGAVFSRINASSSPYNQYVFNNGNVGIGRTPLAQLAVLGGAVQIMGDYPNWQTIIKSAGANGTFTGQLTITIPQMSDGNVDGYGGYSCEVYVAGFEGWYCHAWFSGYINGGITSSEATILRSNGGWSISQASFGANNQGFQFVVNYPTPYIVHPTARIIFNKGGSPNSFEYPANSITAVFS